MQADTLEKLGQLDFLVGTFCGPEIMHETAWAKGGDALGRSTGRLVSTAVVHEQTQERDDVLSFSAVSIFAVDPETGEIVMYAFDSVGFLPDPPARGRWVDGQLVLSRATPRGESRTRFSPTRNGYQWSKEFRPSSADPWAVVVEGRMVHSCDAGTSFAAAEPSSERMPNCSPARPAGWSPRSSASGD